MITFVFADVVVPLIIFFHNSQNAFHQIRPLAYPSSIIVSSGSDIATITATRPHRHQGVGYGAGATPSSAASHYSEHAWNLPNGRVQFKGPLSFEGIQMMQDGELESDSPSSSLPLWDPVFLGRCDCRGACFFIVDGILLVPAFDRMNEIIMMSFIECNDFHLRAHLVLHATCYLSSDALLLIFLLE